jgi:ribosomal-protein-alanine N-acetyltransferase
LDPVLIRPAEPADLEAVCTITQLAPEVAQWSGRAVEDFLGAGGEVRVATGRGGVLGFLASRRAGDEIEILNLAVLPQFRRQGLGRQLVDAALLEARERGAKSAHLEVRSSNQQAIGFYSVCGFRVSGRRKRYYRDPVEDALLMEHSLGCP